MATAEFTAYDIVPGDRRSPLRWVLSHARRHRWALVSLFSGAVVNAAFANATARGRIVTCDPATGETCASAIVARLARRAAQ